MTWRRLPLYFELLSPLHIGYLPNQSGTVVARTRCYVPGKNLWGAVTASMTSRLHAHPTASNYREIGESIRKQIVFSYFYLSDGAQLFVPDYTEWGLLWGDLTDRAFRAQFIGSRGSTAIGETGGAQTASLHEIEFVRHRIGTPGASSRKVLLAGVAWIHEDARIDGEVLHLEDILRQADLVLGGEHNYGFGRLRWVPNDKVFNSDARDRWPLDPAAPTPVDGGRPLAGHAPYRHDRMFRGEIEIVAGREYRRNGAGAGFQRPGTEITNAGYYFAPGTRLGGGDTVARLDPCGRLIWV